MKVPQVLLKIFSVLIVIGGLVRLVANRQTFQSFTIGELWVSHPYFSYVYRVLGAFVVYSGATMFVIAHAPFRYATILKVCGFCFLFVSMVMFVAGYTLHMTLVHYAFDFLFCVSVATVCFLLGYQREKSV